MPDTTERTIPAWQPVRGRRTKLTPSLVTELSTYLRSGQCMEIASQLCGVTSASVRSWTRKAEEIQERLGEEEPSSVEESLFLSFLAAVSNARAEAVARAVMNIRLAERDDWRAAAWYLERTRPDLYGSVQRHKHEFDKLTDDELLAEATRLLGTRFVESPGVSVEGGEEAP